MSDAEVGKAVPAEQKQGWGQFLKAIANFSGDLSSLTAPSFILSPISLVEYPSYWGEHPDLFAACSQGKDDVEQMTHVLRWFIATLKGQYTARNTSMGSEKKPLNPVLGEIFLGTWPDKNDRGEITLVAEQVSHHPPVTAYSLSNEKAKVILEGHSGQKTAFSGGSINVKQVGHAVLRVPSADKKGETIYLITLPNLVIEGLIWGSPYIELGSTSYISSSSGYVAEIHYSGKGYFSGKAHTFKAAIAPAGQLKHPLYSIEGDWSAVSKFKGASPDGGKDGVFWDADGEREELTVKPIEEQGPMESRKVWQKTAEGIKSQNYEAASKDKSRIENEQRQKRKDETAAGTPHQLEYFVHIAEDKEYTDLAAKFGGKPATEEAFRRKPRVH